MQSIRSEIKIKSLIEQGVVILDPLTTYIDETCYIGKGTVIYPNVIINEHVEIKENCTIYSNTNICNHVVINDQVKIGQFTLIREYTQIGFNTSIGPHCEITRSILGCNCVIGHKNYIGDAILMDEVKFGANVIIANTNWKERFKTFIGSKTQIGVNATLIAPINIGSNCFIAAGTVLHENIEDDKFVKQKNELDIRPNKLSIK